MKKILGLDLGTNSIGWAVVNEADMENEVSTIVKLGVRTIHFDNFVSTSTGKESKDPIGDFMGGKGISACAGRTKQHSMRLRLDRYQLRREHLIAILQENGIITNNTLLSENGNNTTFETYRLRAKAAVAEISLEAFARVLLMINKKRGYKSSRKAVSADDGVAVDSMDVAKLLYENELTPGQYSYSLLQSGKKRLPDFYRSDLKDEFNKVWNVQREYYPNELTAELYEKVIGRERRQTFAICANVLPIEGVKRDKKGFELKLENYALRNKALSEKLSPEELVTVFQEINDQISKSSGYLGNISDRSKELFFNKLTVGQYKMKKLDENPNVSLKNMVFYRQDYMDEFETIWDVQSKFHKELTPELKKLIRDVVIFYQRPLKSQKGLISLCEFESREIEVLVDGKPKKKKVGLRVCPKSSPLFQEFKIWQILNNLVVKGPSLSDTDKKGERFLTQDEKEKLFKELNVREKLSAKEAVKVLYGNVKDVALNYEEVEGNRTQAAIVKACISIINNAVDADDEDTKWSSQPADVLIKFIKDKLTSGEKFKQLGIDTSFLDFNCELEDPDYERQPAFRLWHMLYSFEGEDQKLVEKLTEVFHFDTASAKIMSKVIFKEDYGSLSSKAIRKILPYLKGGNTYSMACEYAGYRHSKRSLTKEEIANKPLKDKLELIPQNSLRNPVVEKILNQMINVVNGIVDEYGKPDEIRIELARELKKSATERAELADNIKASTKQYEEYRKILQKAPFNIEHVSKNDLLRYRLYLELAGNGFHTLYSNTYIPQEKLFSKEFDIEHIIPQARLFDDSFSNKTLEARDANIEKSSQTAYDYVKEKYGEQELAQYENRIESLYKEGRISKSKRNKLLMTEKDIPSGFIERDLRDSQYIAKKAREILEDLVRVVMPTCGAITDRLREDWQLVDIMKELNWDKYDKLGLTESFKDKDGRTIYRIKDWTKRNDNRHHAMDALTIAFTRRNYIQYLNNLNARIEKNADDYIDLDMVEWDELDKKTRTRAVKTIEKRYLTRGSGNKLRFISPIQPLEAFRAEAKKQLENVLISVKSRSKVVTKNTNITKKRGGVKKKVQLTPRGQLHNETIYGQRTIFITELKSVDGKFDSDMIKCVTNKRFKNALSERLKEFGGDPKKAFAGKNGIAEDKNPIYLDAAHAIMVPTKVEIRIPQKIFTIRKEISQDLKVEKVIDEQVRKILQDRLNAFGGDPKLAFANLDENPIWQNESKQIAIRKVTLKAVNEAESLHVKKDHNGKTILDKEGNVICTDYVSTSNNHHVAIYEDADGKLQEKVVSFYEATACVTAGIPIIDKEYKKDEGWKFKFTMKRNEYFVFPNPSTGFDPNEVDFMNENNYDIISPNLYRVQSLSTKDYWFRHHLETTVEKDPSLSDITYKRIRNAEGLKNIVKVRINHIGKIVSIGEY
ncbi:MAG: type II CRISPR RNA-guided endonuclease Cas9 [Paludibacteraceae bacterium]|nr:type II CRISPR RNA-guided endonuclease Cas9 [Paludibacteraceae bacterium]